MLLDFMAKKISKVLEDEWKKLISIRETTGEEPPVIFQRNLFYKCRTRTIRTYGKSHVCNFAYFKYDLIYNLENKYGYSREQLGIRAKPDATLYKRHGMELIEYQHRKFPVISIIATEKSGIAESLAQYLTKYGIYVVDTTGNQGRYPIQLVESRTDVPVFCIEDFDITGCFMSQRFKNVKAERIDLLYIAKKLGVPEKELWEEDSGGNKNSHRYSISSADKKLLKKKNTWRRIEIDTVLEHAEPEDFARVVLDFLDTKIPVKDMSKVMDLGEWVYIPIMPKKEREKLDKQIEKMEEEYGDAENKVLDRYKKLKKPFEKLKLDELEEKAKQKFEEEFGI